jgi:hypothetical protein
MSELKPPFEVEFPDPKHPERDAVNKEYESGQINASQAGYSDDPLELHDDIVPAATPYDEKVRSKTSYPRGGTYAPHPHPKKPSSRIRTVGDANSGDPNLR